MSAFRVGQKVVCIFDRWKIKHLPTVHRVPMLHELLTVASVDIDDLGREMLTFEEIPEIIWRRTIWGWLSKHFRPLVTRTQEQDLAIFLPLLTPSPEPVA